MFGITGWVTVKVRVAGRVNKKVSIKKRIKDGKQGGLKV